MSYIGRFLPGTGAAPIETITGNSGGAVGPSASGNLNLLGGNNINIVGVPATNTLTVNVSGTTNHAVQVGNASGSLTSIPVGLTGQVLTGVTGADPVFAAPPSSFTWQVITVSQTAVVNHGYITNSAGTLQLLLPATAAIGDIIEVTGINNATGWQITQNANQQIFIGTASTTLGVGGSLTSSATRDSIRLVCVVAGASSVYNAISFVGNITFV